MCQRQLEIIKDGIVMQTACTEVHRGKDREWKLNILTTHDEGAVKNLSGNSGWQEIYMAVDSGTSETAVGPEMLTNIDTVVGPQRNRGVQYEGANGKIIHNF